jgi:cytochrome c-type biogenesis protein CcmH
VAAGLLDAGPAASAAAGRSRKPWMLALAAVAVAAAAGLIHDWVDRSGPSIRPTAASAPAAPASGEAGHAVHALSDEQLQRMIDQTRLRVQKDPKDAASWAMLAHSYDMLGEFAESSKAYATLARLVPGDAQVLADYADALAVANGRTLAGEPAALVGKALALDPRNVKALTLAGTAAFERQDYGEAVTHWQQARALSHDPAFVRQIDVSLANARASAQGLPASAPATAAAPATTASAVVAGRLTLAEDLVSRAPPDATVFIFAIPVGGSRMPVAITRRHVRDLPLEFALDDSMAMVRDLRLSSVATVVVGARISARGDIAPQPGDMQGLTAPVGVGTRGIRLEISEVLK